MGKALDIEKEVVYNESTILKNNVESGEKMENSTKTISLDLLWSVFVKKWFLILLAGILAAGLAFGYSFFLKKQTYQSKTTMMIYNTDWQSKSSITSSDINSANALVESIQKAVKENISLNTIVSYLEENGVSVKPEKVAQMVSASNSDTMYLTITAVDSSANLAHLVVQAYEANMPDIITTLFPSSTINVTTEATKSVPISKKVSTFTVIGFIAGAALVFGIILAVAIFDTTIKSEADFKRVFDIPVLGVTPDIANFSNNKKGGHYNYGSYAKK